MSYGASFADFFRRSATYAHKILQGSKPSDLPVEQPTKLELVINLKAAEALGVKRTFLIASAMSAYDPMRTWQWPAWA
jgi:ABC-type uncharacterized transport system substrate-binding protein